MLPPSNRLIILTYHRVIDDPGLVGPGEVDAIQFGMHAEMFARYFNVLRLTDAVNMLRRGRLPRRALCITFDDGYRDNVSVALPILADREIPATFFIATGYLDGGIMWNDVVIDSLGQSAESRIDLDDLGLGAYSLGTVTDRRTATAKLLGQLKYRPQSERDSLSVAIADRLGVTPPRDLMMRSEDLPVLRDAGMELGGHTRTHPILSVADDDSAEAEIVAGKRDIEELLQEEVTSFAYPNGRPGQDFEHKHVDMVARTGFSAAVTTASGPAGSDSDLLQLGRFGAWHRSRPKLLLRMMLNYYADSPETA